MPGASVFRSDLWRSSGDDLKQVLLQELELLAGQQKSTAYFLTYYFQIVLRLIEGAESRDEVTQKRKDILLALSQLVRKKRPFPTLRWSRYIDAHIDDPADVKDELHHSVKEVRAARANIEVVTRANIPGIGLSPGMTVFIPGYADSVEAFLVGLDIELVNKLKIKVFEPPEEGFNPLWDLLRAERFTSLSDAEAFLTDKGADLLVFSTKTLGLDQYKRLTSINNPVTSRFVRLAKDGGAKIVLASAVFKIWPFDLFQERDRYYSSRRDGTVKEDSIDIVVSDRLVSVGAKQFIENYEPEFTFTFEEVCSRKAEERKLKYGKTLDIDRVDEVDSDDEDNWEPSREYLEGKAHFEEKMKDATWVKNHRGQYVAFTDRKLLYAGDSPVELYENVYKSHEARSVFVQKVPRIKPFVRGRF